ncbi:ankyrin repeat domain-containing protein 26-like isoform X2 [Chionomys nivalis]|uniref:ankyrin repeat domain-containing protein 26-like isoform X2 n=1 Tax=Chionomys nivalis TaxID=269649 RepID=UPI00259A25AE|nr:ankyrin repeat domain-containing protein 26-like isoform X2 [Chionomys nivalis]
MKKIFGFRSKGPSPLGPSARPRNNCVGFGRESASGAHMPRYHIHDKDMGKIHKAASVGDVAKVQHILILGKSGVNDRDKKDRTALHLACAYGHPEVVTLLVERKCEIDACDGESSTALIKAVQCQEEECATILLEHGANPDVMDSRGNTALHYAVLSENTSIAAKLLAHNANMEAKNKDDLTPLLLAVKENKQHIVEFLVKKKTSCHAVDQLGSNRQLFEYDGKRQKTSENSNPVDNGSEDESLSRSSHKPDPADSWPSSDEDDYSFDTKNVPKINLTELWAAAQQSKKNQTKCGIENLENSSLFDNSNSNSEHEDAVEIGPGTSAGVRTSSPSCPSPEPVEGATEPAIGREENGTDIVESASQENDTDIVESTSQENGAEIVESASQENGANIVERASQEQPNHSNLAYASGWHKSNKSEMMTALGLGEDEDEESPWDSESISDSVSLKGVDRFYGAADPTGQTRVHGQVEDVTYIPSCMSGSRNFKMAKLEESRNVGIPVAHKETLRKYPVMEPSIKKPDPVLNKTAGMKDVQTFRSEPDLEEQKRLGGSEDSQRKVEEKRKYKNNEAKLSGSLYSGAADSVENGVNQQSGKADDQQFPVKGDKEHDRGPPLLMKEMKKKENEKCVSRESVTMPMTEKPGSPPGGPLHLQDGSSLSDTDQSETRPTKKASIKNNKVKKQVAAVDDLDDLNELSETASEDCELQCPDYESVLCEIEHLRMECRDIVSLLKIRDAVYSYKRLIEFKRSHCELLTGKLKRMENKFKELQKEVSETKEVRSLLEHEKAEWEQELSSLRFALKQEEEKRRSADLLSEKTMEQLRRKDEQYQSEVEGKQQLEVSLRTLDMELKTVRNHLNQVLEERNEIQRQLSQEQNARMLQDGILANHLCKQKEIEMAQKRMTSEVSVSHEKEKDLLHKNQRLQDEIAMLRLEMDTVKSHNQEKEKKYLEDIKTANEKSDKLQRTIKLNEETFTKTIFQYNGQLNNLKTENTMLSSKLENEKQNKERLETDVESFRSRLASAMHDHAEIQASKRDLEIAFQRARDEWLRLQDKMNFDLSNLRDNNEILSQQLSKTEKKLNSLEIEFHHTKDALREKTLALKHVQRDLNQTQCQMKEVEHLYQDEQGKVNKYMGKQESIEERLSQLQSENMLLRQQLDDASNKADSKDKTIVNIQDQFHDMLGRLQAEGQKHRLMLEDRNKELVSECSHFKERLCQYENEKAEREVVVRRLQQELADTLKKQSMSEASLEVSSRYRSNLEDEARDLKKKLGQLRSQLQEAQDQHREAVQHAEKMQDHLQKLELENSNFKITIKNQSEKIEQLQENLSSVNLSEEDKEKLKKLAEVKESLECTLEQEQKRNDALEEELRGFKELLKKTKKELSEHENRELNRHQDIKNSQFEMDIPVNMLIKKIDDLTSKLETTSSKCLHLGKKNQVLQQELLLMKTIQKKCVKLEKNKRKLEQEVDSLRSHMEKNMVEHSQLQQYRREVEEQARQDLVEKLKQVNLFLQAQAASQENLEQLRESSNASVRSQMELRIKDLESQLSRMKSQEDFDKIELEKYKQLYQEELRVRKSLSSKLNKTNERLEEASTKLLLEEQQNRSLLSSLSTRPIVECPCVGGLHNSLVFNRTLIPRENIVIPTSSLQPSNKRMEIYLTKMHQELEKSINRELKEAAAELESEFCRVSPLGSATKPGQDLLSEASQEYIDILKKKYTIC